jgi:rhodanese-related sulfurtransferase
MKPLTLDAVLALQADGAQVGGVQVGVQILDTRDPEEFAAAHLAGSINIGLGGQYATWAGTVLDPAHPIVIIAAPGRESESATRLGRIGFDHVVGYLENGMQSLDSRPDLIASTEHLSAQSAAERLSSSHAPLARPLVPPLLIDVRTPREREQKHIPGSLSVPLNRLAEHLSSLPKDRPLLVYCAGGYRSSVAASLLQRSGFQSVAEIAGGFAAWEAANLPVVAAAAEASR